MPIAGSEHAPDDLHGDLRTEVSIPATVFDADIAWIPADERYASNVVAIGAHAVVAEGYPRTHEARARRLPRASGAGVGPAEGRRLAHLPVDPAALKPRAFARHNQQWTSYAPRFAG